MPKDNSFFRVAQTTPTDTIDRYKILKLRDNPFPSKTGVRVHSNDVRSNGTIYEPSVRNAEQHEFDNIFLPGPNNPHAKKCAFVMDYATSSGRGIGKTAFLNYQARRIANDWGQTVTGGESLIFAARIQPEAETRKYWEFSKLLAKALIEEQVIAKALWRIRYFHPDITDAIRAKVDVPEHSIGCDKWLREQGVEPMYFAESVAEELKCIGIPYEIAKKLAYFGNDMRFEEMFMEKESDVFWRKQGDKFVFDWLVKLFRHAGITNGLLLVDEVEKIVYYQNKSERRSFVESIRYCFFDGDHENTKHDFYRLLLTIHPYIQELLLPHWESSGLDRFAALSRELSKNYTIYFNPIEKEMAVAMAKKYIEQFQLNAEQSEDPLHPFSERAIIEATLATKGVPGKLLTFLHEAVEQAVQRQMSQISQEFVHELATLPVPKEHDAEEVISAKPDSIAKLKKGGLNNEGEQN